ncbi:hypothetical protein D7V91_05950 [bacterium 1xD42-67]|nr:hypothetical protein D7V91_05950 [bacterium 1xD42-67]
MMCPWCDQEMEQGFLMSSRPVIFGPEERESVLWPRKKGEVELMKLSWTISNIPAWHCARCRRVVAEHE